MTAEAVPVEAGHGWNWVGGAGQGRHGEMGQGRAGQGEARLVKKEGETMAGGMVLGWDVGRANVGWAGHNKVGGGKSDQGRA